MKSHEMVDVPSVRDALNRSFLRHFLEMIVAMAIGMAALDEVAWLLFSGLAGIDMFANPLLFAPVMTVNMIIGMGLYMKIRHHSALSVFEMSAAMVIPVCILIGPHWLGLVSGDVLVAGSMILMLPAMVGVMLYRRGEYSMSHQQHLHREHMHEHMVK
jgi:hypothetical protein